jgi:hypothetical protein
MVGCSVTRGVSAAVGWGCACWVSVANQGACCVVMRAGGRLLVEEVGLLGWWLKMVAAAHGGCCEVMTPEVAAVLVGEAGMLGQWSETAGGEAGLDAASAPAMPSAAGSRRMQIPHGGMAAMIRQLVTSTCGLEREEGPPGALRQRPARGPPAGRGACGPWHPRRAAACGPPQRGRGGGRNEYAAMNRSCGASTAENAGESAGGAEMGAAAGDRSGAASGASAPPRPRAGAALGLTRAPLGRKERPKTSDAKNERRATNAR